MFLYSIEEELGKFYSPGGTNGKKKEIVNRTNHSKFIDNQNFTKHSRVLLRLRTSNDQTYFVIVIIIQFLTNAGQI